MTITIGSLCSGYGGVEMALRQVLGGAEVAWLAELDPDMSQILKREHPDAPNVGDLVTAPWERAPAVDLVAAGFPCQPVSAAGRQKADADHRWLWPSVLRIVRMLKLRRPPVVFLENVQNIVSIRGGAILREILNGLRAAGYEARWTVLGACAVGAPHHRHRWFLLARFVGSGAPPAVRVGGPRAICGAPRSGGRPLLPTPTARDSDSRGEGDHAYWSARAAGGRANGMPLGAAAALLPTPTARDGMGGPGHAADGGMNLRTVAPMLPTPMAADADRGSLAITRGNDTLRGAVQPERWGKFAEAVALWERITGMAAPEPTERAPKGGYRLSPLLPEWMMGLPPGYLTADLDRAAALRGAGNGVCPRQAAAAWRLLTS